MITYIYHNVVKSLYNVVKSLCMFNKMLLNDYFYLARWIDKKKSDVVKGLLIFRSTFGEMVSWTDYGTEN